MPGPESRLRANFRGKLKLFALLNGGRLKWWSNADAYATGRPDMELVWRGLYASIELKSADGKPSPLQSKSMVETAAAGGFAVIVRPGVNRERFLCEPWGGEPFEFSHVADLLDRIEQQAVHTRP